MVVMFEDRGFELGIFSGLLVAVIGSIVLPGFELVSTLAAGATAAFLTSKNGKEGLLSGFVVGFTLLFFAVVNLYHNAAFPIQGLVGSAISYAPFNRTMPMFIFASAYIMISTTLAGGITGFLKYEEDYEFSTV